MVSSINLILIFVLIVGKWGYWGKGRKKRSLVFRCVNFIKVMELWVVFKVRFLFNCCRNSLLDENSVFCMIFFDIMCFVYNISVWLNGWVLFIGGC